MVVCVGVEACAMRGCVVVVLFDVSKSRRALMPSSLPNVGKIGQLSESTAGDPGTVYEVHTTRAQHSISN